MEMSSTLLTLGKVQCLYARRAEEDAAKKKTHKSVSRTLLTSDNQEIAYCHYKNNHSKVVVIAHGFFTSKDSQLLQSLAHSLLHSYDVFMFDFRGHGKSSGLFSWTSKEDRDVQAVLQYLEGKYERKGFIAFSLGGSIAINVLAEKGDIDSLICVSSPSSFEKIDYRFWELNWHEDIVYSLFTRNGRTGKGVRPGPFWLKKKKPLHSVRKLIAPVLYIHGENDWVIKPWHSQVLYQNTSSKKKIVFIEGGSHAEFLMRNFSGKLIRLIKAWFKDTLTTKGN